jgi:hypothetical protein
MAALKICLNRKVYSLFRGGTLMLQTIQKVFEWLFVHRNGVYHFGDVYCEDSGFIVYIPREEE